MSSLRLSLFGTPRVERDGKTVSLSRRKTIALLAYLAASGQPHSRDALSALLWPDNDQSSARANLRRDLSRLKSALGDDALRVDRLQTGLSDDVDWWIDIVAFRARAESVRDHDHDQQQTCATCLAAATEAVELYTDDFMAGFSLPDSAEFDEWQFFEAEALRRVLADLLQLLIEWHTAQREFSQAIEYGRRWLALDTLHEPAHRQLMRLYDWADQHAAALRQYQECVRLLDEELGVEPEEATTDLYERIRQRQLKPPRAAMPTPPPVPQPEVRYEAQELLAAGGYGDIYRGRDHVTGETVVLKRLRAELVTEDAQFVARFAREGELLRQLDHPNIVRMLDVYESSGQHTIVMEYVPGGTLRDLMEAQGPLPVAQSLDIALELADALTRAHHLGIIHRDLKPENVLLAEDGTPRLTDFGLARLERDDTRLTRTGTLLGSPAYMSPEALRGEELDARSDVWALGVLLFEMLAGQRPFPGESLTAVLMSILNDPVLPLTQCRPDAPAPLADLLQQMLLKDRERRLGSMRQVAAALEAIRAGREIEPLTLLTPTLPAPQDETAVPTLHNLPPQPTGFVGRQDELSQIRALLLDEPACRLLTLLGPGGIGKTRLAIEAGKQALAAYPDGVFFVPLTAVSEPDFIVPAVAEALDFQFAGATTPRVQLLHHLRSLRLLLIFDNFEHVLGGADIVADILRMAPDTDILVTSRERLKLQEEWSFEVHGMPYPHLNDSGRIPDLAELETFSAPQLFIQRARRADAGFAPSGPEVTAVIEICRLLDGMPLGLELAAPWVRFMSCAEIAAEIGRSLDFLETSLRNVPERHRSLRAVFEQTWATLQPPEQVVLQGLSVFRGGCRREAAERVVSASVAQLASLVDRALLRRSRDGRFELHELIRQFAAAHLQNDPAVAAQLVGAHSRYYLDFLTRRTADIKGGRQKAVLAEIAAEIDNVRAAWAHAVAQQDSAPLAGAAEGLWLFSEFRGVLHEGEKLFGQAVESLDANASPAAQALTGFLRAGQGSLAARRGWFEAGLTMMEAGIAQLQAVELCDAQKEGFALAWLAFAEVMRGRFDAAEAQARIALNLASQTGDRWVQAGCLRLLGASTLLGGQLAEAERLLLACLATCREIGERRIRTYATTNLGLIALARGQYAQADHLLDEALQISRQLGDRLSRADLLREQGRLLMAQGQYSAAAAHIEDSLSIYHDIGRSDIGAALCALGAVRRLQGEYAEAERLLHESLAASRAVNHQPEMATCLVELARLVQAQGRSHQAEQLLQEALAIWQGLGNEPEEASVERFLGHVTAVSGAARLAEARRHFRCALQLALSHEVAPIALDAIAGVAELKLRDAHVPEATELLSLVRQHPAAAHFTREAAEIRLRELPADALQAIQLRESPTDWQTAASQLAEELAAPGWEQSMAQKLPQSRLPFVGRTRELEELQPLLRDDPTCRLLTLVGPGGIGKSRLAVELARLAGPHFAHGVYHVSLAPLEDPAHIAVALAESLGFRSFTAGEPRQLVLDFLHRKQALVVLDNFEHLLAGTSLVSELVTSAPQVKIIATSRERLNLSGEVVYVLAGMDFPETAVSADLTRYSAVQLMLEHARLTRPDYALQPTDHASVLRIVRMVQGMPLALVLAAGWLDMLTWREIADEIARSLDFLETERRDMPSRQRSVRAVFDGSWARLPADAQRMFARLTVFRGGFTREAAQVVAGAELRGLRALVNSSFIALDENGRYQIHELLRQYGAEQLDAMGEREQTRNAHSTYFLQALQRWEPELQGLRQVAALAEVEAELENVRAAWQWGVRNSDHDGIDGALECLHLFSDLRGRYREGAEMFAQAREAFAPGAGNEPDPLWARIVLRHGFLRIFVPALWDEVVDSLEQSLALAERYDLREEIALAHLALATYLLFAAQEPDAALVNYEKGLALFRELGVHYYEAMALMGVGVYHAFAGSAGEGEQATRESLRIAREHGNLAHASIALTNLAEDVLGRGDLEQARALCEESVQLAEEVDNPVVGSYAQTLLSFLHFLQGDLQAVNSAATQSLVLAERINYAITAAYANAVLGLWNALEGNYEEGRRQALTSRDNPANNTVGLVLAPWALALAEWGMQRWDAARAALVDAFEHARALSAPAPLVWLLPVAAVVAAAMGDDAWAVELLGLAQTHPMRASGWVARWAQLADAEQLLRERLGEAAFGAAWARGEALDLETAVVRIMEDLTASRHAQQPTDGDATPDCAPQPPQ